VRAFTHASACVKISAEARDRASGRAENEDGTSRSLITAIRSAGSGVLVDRSMQYLEDARCGRAVCIGESLFARVLHVCSIHSAEKGEKGQVVAASEGRWGNGKTLETAAAFRNVTFPFCRSTAPPADLSGLLPHSVAFSSISPFVLAPRALRSNTHDSSENSEAPALQIAPYLRLISDHSTRAALNVFYPLRDVTIIRGASEREPGLSGD